MTSLVSAENISVIRGRQVILNDVSLAIGPTDFVTIVGPNGAGKSILLKCLIGIITPEQGHVRQAPNLKIGYVPQRLVADHTIPITARRFMRLRKKTTAAEVLAVAAETMVDTILDKPLHVLSGGELQRVLLARALLGGPNLLVLDEPAQNLDVPGQLAFYKLLEKVFAEREIAIVMVSHDLHLVMASTNEVVCLFHHICCSGTPQAVTRDPEFISLFGDDMARLMAVYHHSHDHEHEHEQGHAHEHRHEDGDEDGGKDGGGHGHRHEAGHA